MLVVLAALGTPGLVLVNFKELLMTLIYINSNISTYIYICFKDDDDYLKMSRMVMITNVSSGMGPRKVLKLDKLQFGSHPRIKCDHDDENRK